MAGSGDDGQDDQSTSAAGGAPPPAARAASEAERLPLERRVGELLVMSFDTPAAPDYILRRLRSGNHPFASL